MLRRYSRVLSSLVLLLAILGPALPTSASQVASPAAVPMTPAPIEFPRDDGPHDEAMEWWYYTGHLFSDSGDRYGFEMVVFKAQQDDLIGYAAHVAVVDPVRGEFVYDERVVIGDSIATPVTGGGFNLQLGNWRMSGANGNDRLVGSVGEYAFALQTRSTKPPALHDGEGFVDYGSGQYSYYYSRTRLEITGTFEVGGESFDVNGEAWMDHQWGNFTTWDSGGWDWFALQLDDGREVMLYVVYAPDGTPAIVDGSLVAPDGTLTVLEDDDFTITPTGTWTSPETGVVYPSGWSVELPAESLLLTVDPVMPDQELDTSLSTGQIYWEGQVTIEGSQGEVPVGGLGYVELTGYADLAATPEASPSPAAVPAGG